MSRFPNRPLVMAWCFRDLNRMVGWVFGFILAPEPPERQVPGGMCRAFINLEVWVQFRHWPFVVVHAFCADPGGPRDRPCTGPRRRAG